MNFSKDYKNFLNFYVLRLRFDIVLLLKKFII